MSLRPSRQTAPAGSAGKETMFVRRERMLRKQEEALERLIKDEVTAVLSQMFGEANVGRVRRENKEQVRLVEGALRRQRVRAIEQERRLLKQLEPSASAPV